MQNNIPNPGEKLKIREKLGFAFCAMGSDMTIQTTSLFLQLFYTSVVGIPIKWATLVISLSVIWDAINDPVIASWADNHTFKNGERIRPILAFSCVPFALFFALNFTTLPGAGLTAKTVYSFAMYFIYMIPRTFFYLPIFTLRQVATPDVNERLKLNVWISYGQAFGSSLPSLVMWPLILMFGHASKINGESVMENPERGYLIAVSIVGLVVVAASLFNYFTTKERVVVLQKKTSIMKAMAILLKDRNFILSLLIFFFYGLICTLCTGYVSYYCKYVISDSMLAAINSVLKPVLGEITRSLLITVTSAFFIIGTLAATPFVKKMYNSWGRIRTLIFGSLLITLGAAVFTALARVSLIGAFFFTLTIGAGTAITIIVIGMNRADVTDVIECRQGERMDGMVSNCSSFINKLAKAFVVFLIGLILDGSGFISAQLDPVKNKYVEVLDQPESAKVAIVALMGVGVIIVSLLMAFCSSRLTLDKEMEKYGLNKK